MYKILTLVRNSGENALLAPSLWSPYMIENITMVDDPDGKTDPDTGDIIQIEKIEIVEFETEDLVKLSDEVKKLLETIPKAKIKPVSDLTFTLDVLITP